MYESFGPEHFRPLLQGAKMTALLCVTSSTVALAVGAILGICGTLQSRVARAFSAAFVGFIRGIPVLMIIFFCYFGIPTLFPRLSVDPLVAAIAALSIFGSAYIGEIVRGSILAVATGQGDAADALALTTFQRYRYVILPQAARLMLPPGIGFLLILLKDSSLVSVIGLIELARAGVIISNLTNEPIVTYLAVGVIYFVMCFIIAHAGRRLEERLARNHGQADVESRTILKGDPQLWH